VLCLNRLFILNAKSYRCITAETISVPHQRCCTGGVTWWWWTFPLYPTRGLARSEVDFQ